MLFRQAGQVHSIRMRFVMAEIPERAEPRQTIIQTISKQPIGGVTKKRGSTRTDD